MIRLTLSNSHFFKLLFATFLTSCLISISACQKTDSNTGNSDLKVTEINAPDNISSPSETDVNKNNVELGASHNGLESDTTLNHTDNMITNTSRSEQPLIEDLETDKVANQTPSNASASHKATSNNVKAETQVTDVEYRDDTGQSIKVTFQTSAVEALEADLMLPSGKRVLLTAPASQGNNPTYRSKDGSIELVTHGGGNSIDLLYQGKSSSFEAVNAEAEVITPQ